MKKLTQIMFLYNDGSAKGYNRKAFLEVFKYGLIDYLTKLGFYDEEIKLVRK